MIFYEIVFRGTILAPILDTAPVRYDSALSFEYMGLCFNIDRFCWRKLCSSGVVLCGPLYGQQFTEVQHIVSDHIRHE